MKHITGTVVLAGDDITAEMICAPKYRTGKRGDIAKHLFSDCPELAAKKFPETAVLVAGRAFGSGDDPESTARALLAGGVRCVIARSFPRDFFRSSINSGLALITADLVERLHDGDSVCIDLRKGLITCAGDEIPVGKYAERVARVIEHGGLINAVRRELGKE